MTRIIATSLRIAWSQHPRNVSLGMAAGIFVYAGIPILFIANLFFAERIVRAQHPHFGWARPFSAIVPASIIITIPTILVLISAVIVQFYTYQAGPQQAVRDMQLYGQSFFAVLATLPLFIVGISSAARAHPNIRMTRTMDKFGSGSMRAKIAISIISAIILSVGAWYRAGTAYLQPTPQNAPSPDYFSKASFYVFNFTLEIIVVYSWLALRIDTRFFVPDGAKGPFSYANGFVFAGEPGYEKNGTHDDRHGRNDGYESAVSGSESYGKDSAADLNPRTDSYGRRRRRSSAANSRREHSIGATSKRSSWAGSARSSKHDHRVSWGGLPLESLQPAFGEDGAELPYAGHSECIPDEISAAPEPAVVTEFIVPQKTKHHSFSLPSYAREQAPPVPPVPAPPPQTKSRPHSHQPGTARDILPFHTELPSYDGLDPEAAAELGFDERTGKWITRPLSESAAAAVTRRKSIIAAEVVAAAEKKVVAKDRDGG
jgi:hypothetical protein